MPSSDIPTARPAATSHVTRRGLLALPLVLAAGPCSPPAAAPGRVHGRLIVLRHADRFGAQLSAAGRARAARLPEALADLPIDAIYTTPRQRNIDTATPLARARGLTSTTLLAPGAGKRLLGSYPGKTIVWVGNRRTCRCSCRAWGRGETAGAIRRDPCPHLPPGGS
ncbi:MAG: histidine phosphatase family protein [Paracoccaceae bacterium]